MLQPAPLATLSTNPRPAHQQNKREEKKTYEATVIGNESGDLLSVLDELDSDTLSDGGVGLLGLDSDLLEDDTLGVGRSSSGGGLVDVTEGTLLVSLVGLVEGGPEGGSEGRRREGLA
jgi:hypothetical protein